MTLACEDANSKLVVVVNIASEVVIVADVDAEDHVGNNLLIWELAFGHKVKLLFQLVKILKLKFKMLKLEFVQHFAADVL